MTTAQKMVDYRNAHNVTQEQMAWKANVPFKIIEILESGGVTHPNIVKRIAKAYELTEDEAEELLPENRRPHHPDYDPNKYVMPIDPNMVSVMPKQDVIERYVTEHNQDINKRRR